MSLIDEVEPLEGARELIVDLREKGHPVVLASSAKPDEVDHYLELLDARAVVDGWTTSGDVENTKPEPDLVAAAIEKAGGGKAVMVGDSTWDCESAKRAGIPTVGVLTGGFSEAELRRRRRVGGVRIGDRAARAPERHAVRLGREAFPAL